MPISSIHHFFQGNDMKFKLPLLALLLLVSLSFAVARHDDKGKSATTSKQSCCTDVKKTSDKASATCTMDKANCPMVNGQCSMDKGTKASMKQTGSTKVIKVTDAKHKQAKSGVTAHGTN